MRRALFGCLAVLLIDGVAHATSWHINKVRDPFTDGVNTTVTATGDHGSGIAVRCYEGDLQLFLRLPQAPQPSKENKGTREYEYRFRVDHTATYSPYSVLNQPTAVHIGNAEYVTASINQTTDRAFLGLPVPLEAIIRKLQAGHELVYQMPPSTGPVYRLSLSGSSHYLEKVVGQCATKHASKAAPTMRKSETALKFKGRAGAQSASRETFKHHAAMERNGSVAQHPHAIHNEIIRYIVAIQQKVRRNWICAPGTPDGLSCVVSVSLIPGGDVADAKIVKSSENPDFDRSAVAAVYRAAPLPMPSDPDAMNQMRNFNFEFTPES